MISSMAVVKKRSKTSPVLVVAAASAESSCPNIYCIQYTVYIKTKNMVTVFDSCKQKFNMEERGIQLFNEL
jgi:hypothetical protein